MLANHAPLMAMLEPTELKLYKSGSENPGSADVERFAQGEGYLQVVDNSALLIVEDAIGPRDLDRSALESRLKEAESGARERRGGHRGADAATEREIARAEAFLAIGDGGSG